MGYGKGALWSLCNKSIGPHCTDSGILHTKLPWKNSLQAVIPETSLFRKFQHPIFRHWAPGYLKRLPQPQPRFFSWLAFFLTYRMTSLHNKIVQWGHIHLIH